jgi:hypothetical protein
VGDIGDVGVLGAGVTSVLSSRASGELAEGASVTCPAML